MSLKTDRTKKCVKMYSKENGEYPRKNFAVIHRRKITMVITDW